MVTAGLPRHGAPLRADAWETGPRRPPLPPHRVFLRIEPETGAQHLATCGLRGPRLGPEFRSSLLSSTRLPSCFPLPYLFPFTERRAFHTARIWESRVCATCPWRSRVLLTPRQMSRSHPHVVASAHLRPAGADGRRRLRFCCIVCVTRRTASWPVNHRCSFREIKGNVSMFRADKEKEISLKLGGLINLMVTRVLSPKVRLTRRTEGRRQNWHQRSKIVTVVSALMVTPLRSGSLLIP